MRYDDEFLKWYAKNEADLEDILQTDESMSYMRDFLTEYPDLKQMYWYKSWKDGLGRQLIARKKGGLIFCSVRFSKEGKEYRYLADEDVYKKGDKVVVPVGEDNHNSVAEVVSVGYYSKNEAPFPVEKLKHIVGKE